LIPALTFRERGNGKEKSVLGRPDRHFQGKKQGLKNRLPQIEISLSAQRKIIRLRKIGKMGRKCFHMAVPSIPF